MRNVSGLFLLFWLFWPALGSSQTWVDSYGFNYTRPRILRSNVPLNSLAAKEVPAGLYAQIAQEALSESGQARIEASERVKSQAAKNAAFVAALGFEGNLQDSLSPAQRQELQGRAVLLLATLSDEVGQLMANPAAYLDYQWRSRELIAWLTAYDLLLAQGISPQRLQPARQQLVSFSRKLYQQSTFSVYGFSFFNSIKNNHVLMTAAALGMAGAVLPDDGSDPIATEASTWLNVALLTIDDVMWVDDARQSQRSVAAGYAEGPYYLRYASQNLLPFFRTLSHVLPDTTLTLRNGEAIRALRHPYYDADYDSLWAWSGALLMPDGTIPPIGDTYYGMQFPELMLARMPLPVGHHDLNQQLQNTTDLRADFLAAWKEPATAAHERYYYNSNSGNLIFRGKPEDSLYLHVQARWGRSYTSGGGHNQADGGSFLLSYKGEMLALDPGYLSYEQRGQVVEARHHNMLLVDGEGPRAGAAGVAGQAQAKLEEHQAMGAVQYARVGKSYLGADIQRHFLLVDGQHVLVVDDVEAPGKTISFLLHGNGKSGGAEAETGTFATLPQSAGGLWQRNGRKLYSRTATVGGADAVLTDTSTHEKSYGKAGVHTYLEVQKQTGHRKGFITFLHPHEEQHVVPQVVEQDDAVGLAIPVQDDSLFLFLQTDTLQGQQVFPHVLKASSRFGWWQRESSGGQGFFREANRIDIPQWGKLQSPAPATVKLRVQPHEGQVWVSEAGLYRLQVKERVLEVHGENVSSFSIDEDEHALEVQVNGAGWFTFTTTDQQPLGIGAAEAAGFEVLKATRSQLVYESRAAGTLRLLGLNGQELLVGKAQVGRHQLPLNLPVGVYLIHFRAKTGATNVVKVQVR